jgi:hypothetical protein
MDAAESGIELIKGGIDLLKDEKQKDFFEGIVKSLEVAKTEINNSEKAARFTDAAVKYANQISFILFRQNTITDAMAAALRELPTPEDTAASVQEFNKDRQERIDRVNQMHKEIFDEEKDLDVFTGIIAGLTKEEAERRMAEHEAKIREASQAQNQ